MFLHFLLQIQTIWLSSFFMEKWNIMTLSISIDGLSGWRSVIVFHYLGVVLTSPLPCLSPTFIQAFFLSTSSYLTAEELTDTMRWRNQNKEFSKMSRCYYYNSISGVCNKWYIQGTSPPPCCWRCCPWWRAPRGWPAGCAGVVPTPTSCSQPRPEFWPQTEARWEHWDWSRVSPETRGRAVLDPSWSMWVQTLYNILTFKHSNIQTF